MTEYWYPQPIDVIAPNLSTIKVQVGLDVTFTPAENLDYTNTTVRVVFKAIARITSRSSLPPSGTVSPKIEIVHKPGNVIDPYRDEYRVDFEARLNLRAAINYVQTLLSTQYFYYRETAQVDQAIKLAPSDTVLVTYNSYNPGVSSRSFSPGVLPLNVPRRGIAPPAMPASLTVTAITENTQVKGATLSWAAVSNTAAAPLTGYNIYRKDNGGAYVLIARIARGNTTYTDRFPDNQLSGREAQYAVGAYNDIGESTGGRRVSSTIIRTLVSAVTNLKAKRRVQTNLIDFTWDHQTYEGVTYDLVLNGTTVVTGIASKQYTRINSDQISGTLNFSVVAKFGTSASTGNPTVTVPAVTAPFKPTGVGPNGVFVGVVPGESNLQQPIVWNHNTADTSDQVMAQIEINDGASTRVLTVYGTAQEAYISNTYWGSSPTGVITARVRTRGVSATYSPYSDYITFTVATAPLASITTPANGTVLDRGSTPIAWDYSQAGGSPQMAFEIRIREVGTNNVSTFFGQGTATSYVPAFVFQHGKTYNIQLIVTSEQGVSSVITTNTISVSYPAPLKPTMEGLFNGETGTTEIVIYNPTPSNPLQEVVLTKLYRSLNVNQSLEDISWADWELVLSGIDNGQLVTDSMGRTNGTTLYLAEVSNEVGGTNLEMITVVAASSRVWLNAGPNLEASISIPYNIEITEAKGRVNSEVIPLDGRAKPISITGRTQTHTLEVAGRLDPEGLRGSTWQAFQDFLDRLDARYLYRDMDGRRMFIAPPSVTMERGKRNLRTFTMSLTEVDDVN